jgi:predicted DNA-binding transcriptional regulator YafY
MATPTHSRTTYDRRAIRAAALADARALRSGAFGPALTWREALALALRSAWTAAKRRAENLLAAARSAAGTSGATKPARIPARDLLLTYRDDKGDLTARTVRHRAVRRAATGLLVEADCCLRGAVRQFRADRVVALVDVLLGRVCPDPRVYLAGLEGAA